MQAQSNECVDILTEYLVSDCLTEQISYAHIQQCMNLYFHMVLLSINFITYLTDIYTHLNLSVYA
jgi:hypothetical protein